MPGSVPPVNDKALLASFLQYRAPIIPADGTQQQQHASHTHSKLTAAKDAARAQLQAEKQSRPGAPRSLHAASSINSHPAAAERKDPASRLPTPPVAGRRKAPGRPHLTQQRSNNNHIGTSLTSSVSVQAVHGSSGAATNATDALTSYIAIPTTATASEVLPILMRSDLRDGARILESIFPPRTVIIPTEKVASEADAGADGSDDEDGGSESAAATGEKEGVTGVQHVSMAPSSREDVARLYDELLERLQMRRAKPIGICAIRREIYQDLFAELVRQVILEEPARGVLLQRVRDEMNHSEVVHAQLAVRSDGFAAKKLLTSDHGLQSLRDRVAELEAEKLTLEAQRHDLRLRRKQLERTIEEERLQVSKKQQEELSYLRRANQQLSMRLKTETERVREEDGAATMLTSNSPLTA